MGFRKIARTILQWFLVGRDRESLSGKGRLADWNWYQRFY
jgi:hypothetical protein